MPYKDPQQQREYQRRWMTRNRQKWLAQNGPCVDCGAWADLEVDHQDPAQKIDHRIWSWSAERREVELAKCVTRCRVCHKAKSATERPKGSQVTRSKLTEHDVREIRLAALPRKTLAQMYGVSTQTIKGVRAGTRSGRRRKWKHVQDAVVPKPTSEEPDCESGRRRGSTV